MGIQINGQTDTISATDGSFTISGASGDLIGNLTGNVTGNLTGTASTATAAATAYGISGTPTLSGISSVSTTNLTVNGNAYPSAGPLSNRNLIINGAMQVAQRGTSGTANGYCSVDRIQAITSDTNTQSQESLATSDTPYTHGFRKYYRLKNTTASSAGASTYREIDYRIEAQRHGGSGWNYTSDTSYVTLSFWVRASVTQTYYVYMRAVDGTSQSRFFPISLTANTWTKIEKQIPGGSSVAFDNDNNFGFLIRFIPWYGTTYTGSSVSQDTWFALGSDYVPDMTSTWATTTDATFDITGLQLEVGSVATPFEHRSFSDELQKCLRYYQKSYNYSNAPGTATSSGSVWFTREGTTGRIVHTTSLQVPMRASPTLKYYDWAGTIDRIRTSGGNGQTSNESYAHEKCITIGSNASISEILYQWTTESEL